MLNNNEIAIILKENNFKLLGQIELSEKDYKELIALVRTKVKNMQMRTIPNADLMLSLALVQIAVRRYQDGRFWPCFEEEIGYNIPSARLNYIGKVFFKTIKQYDLFVPRTNDGDFQYVEYIKAHAFVTNFYMQGFYDFSYAYYENNLFRQLNTETIEEDFEDLSLFMGTTLSNKNDNIVESGSNKAAKSYKLLKSTRTTFALNDSKTIRELFFAILKLIDKYFYDNEIPQIAKNRFEAAFIEWCRTQEAKSNQKSENRARTRKEFSHKPYISVNVDKGISQIIIPPQKFRNEDCDGYATAIIEINGYEENIELDVYKSFGILITEEKHIPIPSIFDSINITIKTLSEKHYHIPASNYRIFDRQWKYRTRFDIGYNYILVHHGVPTKWENSLDEIDSYDGYENWNYFSAKIDEESIFYVGNKPISIIGEFSAEPIFERRIEHFSVFDKTGNEIISSREHPTISFVVEKEKLNGSVLNINGIKYQLENIKEKICYDWPEDKKKLAVSVPLNVVLPVEDKRYDVLLDVPGESNKKLCSYLLLKKFDCRFNKPRYTYDETATLKITKGDCVFDATDETWQIEAESEKSISYIIPLETSPETAELILYLYDEYKIVMPIKMFKYGFSELSMKSQKDEYIWYTELKETLYVKIPGAKSVSAYYGKHDMRKFDGILIAVDTFRIDISELVRHIKDKSDIAFHYINLEYEDNAVRRLNLPVIYRTPIIKPYFKMFVEEGIPFIESTIKGDAKLFLNVEDYHGNRIIERKEISNGKTLLTELSANEFYKFSPYAEEKDKFGFNTKTTALKTLENVAAIDMNNLENCDIIVDELCVDENKIDPQYEYRIHINKKQDCNNYLGYMYGYQIENGSKKRVLKADKDGKKIKHIIGVVAIFCAAVDENIEFTIKAYSNKSLKWQKLDFDKKLGKLYFKESTPSVLERGIFKDSAEYKNAYKQIPKMGTNNSCAICNRFLSKRVHSYVYAYNSQTNANKIVKTNLLICEKCEIRYADTKNYLDIRVNYPGYRAVPFMIKKGTDVQTVITKTKEFPVEFFPKISTEQESTNNTDENQEILFIASKYKIKKYKEY